jgi:hypothetical protein
MGNAILVGEHVGEMFSYLSQENWNESKKYSHHTTGFRSHVLLTSEGKWRSSVWGKIGRVTTLDPDKPWFDGSNLCQWISKKNVIHTNGGLITG